MRNGLDWARARIHRAKLAIASQRSDHAVSAPLSYRNAIDLPRICLQDAVRGDREGVYLRSADWRAFKRLAPEFVDNPAQDPKFAFAEADVAYPPSFCASVPNAVLTGDRTVVAPRGIVINDDCVFPGEVDVFNRKLGHKLEPGEFFFEDTGLVYGEDGTLRLPDAYRPVRRVHGSAILLSSLEPLNYGSLLFRVLPKIHAVRRWGLEDLKVIVPPLGSATSALIEMAGLQTKRMIPHDPSLRYRIDHLLVPSLRNNQAFLDPESLDLYTALKERFGRPRRAGKRIYVSRQRFNRTGQDLAVSNQRKGIGEPTGIDGI